MDNNFSKNLKKIRKDNNLSQEQLADELGVSRQAISKWESATAYPEMDKIIALCDKFNVNIDDLLHGDIKEIKGEAESKIKINKAVDDFLKFITDSINLISNMTFKSKLKCLFEQAMIALVLFIASCIIMGLFGSIQNSLLMFVPDFLEHFIRRTVETILLLFCFVASITILIHVFKVRYLDYYEKLKKENNEEKVEEPEEVSKSSSKKDSKAAKKEEKRIEIVQQDENKIIIRDPKHSEYRFLNALWKLIVGCIKFFALGIAFFLCCIIITLAILLALSFEITKTGLFFLGILGSILSLIAITVIFLLIVLNFILNRKNDKKKMIIAFISSLLIFGISCGMIFLGTLNFDISLENEEVLKAENQEFEMTDNLYFYTSYGTINYVAEERDNIKVEYKVNKYCEVETHQAEDLGIYLYSNCPNPTKIAKEFIKNLNQKKFIPISDEIYDITIYTSPANIEILKNNYQESKKERERELEERDYYENRIEELENKIEEYEEKIEELEDNE